MPNICKDRIFKEQSIREEKYYVVYDSYTPNYKRTPVTSKFYSKYDCIDFSEADPELLEIIKKHRDKGPKDKFNWPATENQKYGWFNEYLIQTDRNDNRFYFGSKTADFIKHEFRIKKDSSMKKTKFTGIPFKL